jgi:hypothetical protein
MSLVVEAAGEWTHNCPCCGRKSETVLGFIYDGPTTVVYFAGSTLGHQPAHVNAVLSVGGWGEGTSPSNRHAVVVIVHGSKNLPSIDFPPPSTSPWFGEPELGRALTPEEMMDDDFAYCQQLMQAVLLEDPRVARFL